MKYLIELSYIGTRYCGFQVQPGKLTIQSTLQDAIESVFGVRLPVKGCSRTDAGVHARQYFATFDSEKSIPTEKLPLALNSRLPTDIAVRSSRIVPDSFHVRHDVEWKEYEYLLLGSRIRDPFLTGRAYQCRVMDREQLVLMRRAAEGFIGKHDFAGFMSAGTKIADTVREVRYLEIIEDGELMRIRIAADGFLYNMVRIIVGTLLDVAEGRIEPSEIPGIINSRDRSRAGATAPAEGLYLNRVNFRAFE